MYFSSVGIIASFPKSYKKVGSNTNSLIILFLSNIIFEFSSLTDIFLNFFKCSFIILGRKCSLIEPKLGA